MKLNTLSKMHEVTTRTHIPSTTKNLSSVLKIVCDNDIFFLKMTLNTLSKMKSQRELCFKGESRMDYINCKDLTLLLQLAEVNKTYKDH